MGWVVYATPWPLYLRETGAICIVLGAVWTCVEILAPPGPEPRTVQPMAICYIEWAFQQQDSKSVRPHIYGCLCSLHLCERHIYFIFVRFSVRMK
jgi:hypothetical protein